MRLREKSGAKRRPMEIIQCIHEEKTCHSVDFRDIRRNGKEIEANGPRVTGNSTT
ncbi:hypothetical protein LOAG_12489 [Loa loa]|uniref:Uncharacterized protein n=1 Tax=Loa loa TaxID=7209 RepID=A0A1S0TLK1_LOALO|nr:hypothetical protein LOAG_12489 [Loa loa]EFO16017.2 hypothetical protein LOAG_12489 [Loa loa]